MTEIVLAALFVFVVLPATIWFEEHMRRKRELKRTFKNLRDVDFEKEWF